MSVSLEKFIQTYSNIVDSPKGQEKLNKLPKDQQALLKNIFEKKGSTDQLDTIYPKLKNIWKEVKTEDPTIAKTNLDKKIANCKRIIEWCSDRVDFFNKQTKEHIKEEERMVKKAQSGNRYAPGWARDERKMAKDSSDLAYQFALQLEKSKDKLGKLERKRNDMG